MIKRKAKVHLPKLSDFEPQYISKSNQDTYTLINETFEFLECYFKGSFDWTPNEFPRSFVYISSEGFAFMMKIFFKAVLNRDLIRIKYSAKDNHLLFTINFNTDFISEEIKEKFDDIALKSGFTATFNEGEIEIKTKYYDTELLTVDSITERKVYKTFVFIFFA